MKLDSDIDVRRIVHGQIIEAKPQKEYKMAEAITVNGALGAEDKIMTLESGVLACLANAAVVV